MKTTENATTRTIATSGTVAYALVPRPRHA